MADPVAKTVLKNGIRVVSKKMAHARSVSMGVWVGVGARDESESENGLSHFIEHMIFKGTRRRSAYQIAKEFDAIGGHTNAFTAMEATCYHAKVIDSQTEGMVDILSDIFLNSVFDQSEVEKERPVILQEIGMVEDSPDEYVHLLCGNNFWGDHPLGRSILGRPANIFNFDTEQIKAFFNRFYQPDRTVISLAGNVDHDFIVDLIGPAFESVQPGNGFPERKIPDASCGVFLNHRDLEQMHICLGTNGLPITDPRRYVFSILNTILGGNMSSRLFQEVREKRGLAYSVYSFVSSHVDSGMFGVYLAVEPKRALETTEVVLNEMQRLKKELVDAAELNGAIEYTKGSLLLATESSDNQMVRAAQNEIHFGAEIPLRKIIEKIDAVSAEEIRSLANDLLNRDQTVLTLLGPAGDDQKVYEDLLAG